MDKLIYKKDAIKALTIYLNYIYIGLTGKTLSADKCRDAAEGVIGQLPTVQPGGWLEQNKDRILQAGKERREVEFRIGGRLFAIREKAQ